ncbi:MAG: hypothetical protein ACXQTI_08765 [Candidatus Nezhaarchaeales archaeon]
MSEKEFLKDFLRYCLKDPKALIELYKAWIASEQTFEGFLRSLNALIKGIMDVLMERVDLD